MDSRRSLSPRKRGREWHRDEFLGTTSIAKFSFAVNNPRPGIDRISLKQYDQNIDLHLRELLRLIRTHTCHHLSVKRLAKYKIIWIKATPTSSTRTLRIFLSHYLFWTINHLFQLNWKRWFNNLRIIFWLWLPAFCVWSFGRAGNEVWRGGLRIVWLLRF